MKFIIIKVPRTNEYTYEQTLGLLATLSSERSNGFLGNILGNNKVDSVYSFNIISVKQNLYFAAGTADDNFQHLKNQVMAQYIKADVVELSALSELGQLNYPNNVVYDVGLLDSNYQSIKTVDKFIDVDPMASILSSMSRSPIQTDIYWLQIIARSAGSSATSKGMKEINKISALETPSSSTQAKIPLIQEKIKNPLFNCSIRLITNNPVNSNLFIDSLNVYINPGSNSLKIVKPAKLFGGSSSSDDAYNHKMGKVVILLNSLELASIWHLPSGKITIPTIVWGKRLALDTPDNLPISRDDMTEEEKENMTFVGKTIHKNRECIFGLKKEDRLRHVYIVGKTGTGKSSLIVNMAIEDIRKGNGVAVLDPHGDAVESILNYIPKNRINDVCYFDPSDPEYSYPLNILEVENENQKELVVSGIIAIFYKIYSYSWGPRLEHILRNVLFTLVNIPNSTLPDVMKILHDKPYRDRAIANINDPQITQFWRDEYEMMGDKLLAEAIAPILNKVGQFVTSPMMRKVIQYPKSKVIIPEMMDNKKIFLVDLSQGRIGEDNATLLGSMIITKIQVAAMSRAFQRPEDRVPFYLYVDEFQNFATSSFSKILSEARKYKLGLTLANQYITQIDELVMGAILGNVGTMMCYNVGAQDSEILYKEFGSQIVAEDLTTLDKYQILTRMTIDSRTTDPFTAYALPPPKNISGHKEKIIEQSRKRYGIKL